MSPAPAAAICLAIFSAATARAATEPPASPSHRDLTFLHVSDTHYGQSPEGDATNHRLVEEMNRIVGTAYPAALGGTVGTPRGVIHTGDITNSGKAAEWDQFVRDYGMTGHDGLLHFPVIETFGNHDGGENLPVRNGIIARNRLRAPACTVSPNGLHVSWNWDGVHFISCGISPGTTKHPYDPAHSLEFLESDLTARASDPCMPVVVFHHFGFDKDHSLGWWPEEWRTAEAAALRNHLVAAILQGHAHKPFIIRWQEFDVYHPPHLRGDPKKSEPVTHGFFVFHITDFEVTAAERRSDGTWGITSRKPLGPAINTP